MLRAEVTVGARLPGGLNGGAVRVRVGGVDAVLKAAPLAHPDDLAKALRARRIVDHARGHGYPTPAWLAVGATATHGWQVIEHVDAAPVAELTPSLVGQLVEVVELQAGLASEPYDHWSYAWRIATGRDVPGVVETPEQTHLRHGVARLSAHSPEVAAVVDRARALCADVPPPGARPELSLDLVHADLNPGNVLVRDGVVVAVVDIGNAGCGTRATDLIDLVWNSFDPSLDEVRAVVWGRILDVARWDGAVVVAATRVLLALEGAARDGRRGVVAEVVERGWRVLEEVQALAGKAQRGR